MLNKAHGILNGDIKVFSTSNRGFTPEEIVERAMDKIMYVSNDANPLIKEQAQAYRDHIKNVVLFYLKEAVKSDRTTIANRLIDAGHPELLKLLEK